MDYAIVKTGGKQYRVSPGDVLDVELLEAEEGTATVLDEVLAVSRDGQMRFGAPTVEGARVIAEVQSHYKDRKIIVYKYKAKTPVPPQEGASPKLHPYPHPGYRHRQSRLRQQNLRPTSPRPQPIPKQENSDMAHKKAGGSTNNGRDSNAKAIWASRSTAVRGSPAAPSSSASAAPAYIPAPTSAWARTIPLFAKIDGQVTYEWKSKGKRRVSVYPARRRRSRSSIEAAP